LSACSTISFPRSRGRMKKRWFPDIGFHERSREACNQVGIDPISVSRFVESSFSRLRWGSRRQPSHLLTLIYFLARAYHSDPPTSACWRLTSHTPAKGLSVEHPCGSSAMRPQKRHFPLAKTSVGGNAWLMTREDSLRACQVLPLKVAHLFRGQPRAFSEARGAVKKTQEKTQHSISR